MQCHRQSGTRSCHGPRACRSYSVDDKANPDKVGELTSLTLAFDGQNASCDNYIETMIDTVGDADLNLRTMLFDSSVNG